jgi:hypothetical protein
MVTGSVSIVCHYTASAKPSICKGTGRCGILTPITQRNLNPCHSRGFEGCIFSVSRVCH